MSYYQPQYPGQQPQYGYPNQPPQSGYGYQPPPGPPPSGPPPIPVHSHPGSQNPYQQQPYYPPPPGPPPGHRPGYNPSYITPPGPPNAYHQPPAFPPPNSPMNQSYAPPPMPPPGRSPPISYYLNAPVPTPDMQNPHQPAPPVPGYDPTNDYEAIRKATKGFGTKESLLISTLAPLDSMKMAALSDAFKARSGKDLPSVIESETSGHFRDVLRGIVLGPLWYDVELAQQALSGFGTNETLLTEVIADRTPSDINLLSVAYQLRFHKTLEAAIKGDLSFKTERLYTMMLTNNRPPDNMPVDYNLVEADVQTLFKAGQDKIGTDEIAFCEVIVNRSRPHLAAICEAYPKKHKKTLTKVIKSEFSGHMRFTLLYIVNGAKPRPRHGITSQNASLWRDAKLLEASMKGFGTKDKELGWRVVRNHWDRQRFNAVKDMYQRKYRKTLEKRVEGETSGDQRKVLLALITG